MNEQLSELVEFFRDEGHFMGHQGDEEGWTPEHQNTQRFLPCES